MRLSTLSLALPLLVSSVGAFQVSTQQRTTAGEVLTGPRTYSSSPALHAANRRSSFVEEEAAMLEMEEKSAGVVGAQFFGGNKQKEELYDPVAEANAGVQLVLDKEGEEEETSISSSTYIKWNDAFAFPDETAQGVAKSIQGQINGILYTEEAAPDAPEYVYASSIDWQSPLGATESPFAELTKCLDFYNRVDVAITSGKSLSSSEVELRWEIAVVWPNFWEGRVLLTGKSILTLSSNTKKIVKQVDTMDDESNINGLLISQARPRFWDTYHIGMTPSAELSPKFQLKSPGLFSSYNIYQLPPRLVYQPSIIDTGKREDAAAATIPNHAFCDFIKTMGPRRQRYVPASPLEVRIVRESGDKQRLYFSMPLSVELQTNPTLPLPGSDPETPSDLLPSADYAWQGARTVATVSYNGSPQDPEVVDVRKKLYDAVVRKDGLQPKLDTDGRPQFFFWSNNVKACYTESGLGMSVYEYRPAWARSSEVGIELAMDNDISLSKYSN